MTHSGQAFRHAYAKLNLALAVGPAMPPKGYHPICSWFVAIELCDTVTVERLGERMQSRFEIAWRADAPRTSPIDWALEKDLAVRAHGLLEERMRRRLPVAMRLEKRIPVGGGLGGGSADGAAMLACVNEVYQLGLGREELVELAMRLGSDVAFFLDEADRPSTPPTRPTPPRDAVVSGLGEKVERVAQGPGEPALLILPPFGCPTGPVYGAFDRAPTTGVDEARVRRLVAARAASGGKIPAKELFNDLEAAACVVEPRLRAMLDRLRGSLEPEFAVHVTGSGSTMFCLPGRQEGQAERARGAIARACPEAAVLESWVLGHDGAGAAGR